MNNGLAIDLQHVAKLYRGRVWALQGIALEVRRGEIFGLLGPNGAGKSTLVKIMLSVVRPTRAQGTILDHPIGHKPTLARVGYLPENHRFPGYLTARQALEFFAGLSKVDRRTRRRRAGELLETVGMAEWADRRVGTYSKGMMQRVGLAQALVADPDLVVLDEPTDGVDPLGRRDIRDVLGRLRAEGKTVFVNSHLLSELEVICDRVAILVGGQVARQGTLNELTAAKQRYEIEVAPASQDESRDAIARALARIGVSLQAGARGTLAGGQWVDMADHTVRIGTIDPADVQQIVDALRAEGQTIGRVQMVRPSLEDLFMEAVGDRPAVGGKIGVTQTWALLVDAYRELNAKRLFWITLILSGAFIGAFALIGRHHGELTLAGYETSFPDSVYPWTFSYLVMGLWLTWASLILALISTAGIFPELISSGTIDLYLARPMSRLRLFLTKYFCGLLFVAIQVSVIAVGSFIVMRWRGGVWMPSLFLAVPLVVLVFSYVFAICVLLGVWTRSTVAAILLSILAWGLFSIAQRTESALLEVKRDLEAQIDRCQRTIAESTAELEQFRQHPTDDLLGVRAALARSQLAQATSQLAPLEDSLRLPSILHRVAYGFWTVVPKTMETNDLLDRYLMTDPEATGMIEQRKERDEARGRTQREHRDDAAMEALEERRHRSIPLILGTSLLDEALCLGLAAWMFCRRDY